MVLQEEIIITYNIRVVGGGGGGGGGGGVVDMRIYHPKNILI